MLYIVQFLYLRKHFFCARSHLNPMQHDVPLILQEKFFYNCDNRQTLANPEILCFKVYLPITSLRKSGLKRPKQYHKNNASIYYFFHGIQTYAFLKGTQTRVWNFMNVLMSVLIVPCSINYPIEQKHCKQWRKVDENEYFNENACIYNLTFMVLHESR